MQNTATADLGIEDVDPLVRATLLGTRAAFVVPAVIPPALRDSALVRDATFNGHSGTVTTRGRFRGDRSGWLEVVYAGFVDNIRSLDGRAEFSVAVGGQSATMHVYGMRVSAPDLVYHLSANLNLQYIFLGGAPVLRVSGELGIAPAVGSPVRFRITSFDNELACAGRPEECFRYEIAHLGNLTAGTVHDDVAGSATFTSEGLIEYGQTPPKEIAWADFTLVGIGGRTLGVHPRSIDWTGVTLNVPGQQQRFAGRDKRRLFAGTPYASVPTAPRADAGPSGGLAINASHRLEAFGSVDDDGGLMTANWRVSRAVLNDGLTLSNTDSARASVSGAIPGDYEVELEVSDGTSTSKSYLVATVGSSAAPGRSGAVDGAQRSSLGGNRRASVGERLVFDARDARPRYAQQSTWTWSMSGEEAATASFQDLGDGTAEFTANEPGYYQVGYTSPQGGNATTLIAVDMPFLFGSPLDLLSGSDVNVANIEGVKVQDLDADGRPDILFVVDGVSGTSPPEDAINIRVLRQTAASRFAAHQGLAGGSSNTMPAVVDLDGDGRLDLFSPARNSGAGTHFFLQRPDKSFGPRNVLGLLHDPCTAGQPPANLIVRDIEGDGRNDAVYMRQGCTSRVDWHGPARFGATEIGILDLPPPPAFTAVRQLWAGDFDGDGMVEVVREQTSDTPVSGARELVFIDRPPGGAMAVVDSLRIDDLNSSFGGAEFVVLDIDGDGRDELIGAHHHIERAGAVQIFRRGVAGFERETFDLPSSSTIEVIGANDVDGDGIDELVVTHRDGFVVVRSDAGGLQGSIRFPIFLPTIFGVGDSATPNIALRDLDGDGKTDAVLHSGEVMFGR
jgi:hypothetical protein